MIKQMAAVMLTVALGSAPSAAQTVLLQDNFNGENSGTTALNYTGFANWTVQSSVDLLGTPNGFGLSCESGACVDMAGSTNSINGGLTSKLAYSFSAGDVMRMEMRVRGNQRVLGATDELRFGASFTGAPNLTGITIERNGTTTFLPDQVGGALPLLGSLEFLGADPYVTVAFQFTAQSAGTARFQISAISDNINIGPLFDDVEITRTSAAVPEPATMLLLMTGLAGLVITRQRHTDV